MDRRGSPISPVKSTAYIGKPSPDIMSSPTPSAGNILVFRAEVAQVAEDTRFGAMGNHQVRGETKDDCGVFERGRNQGIEVNLIWAHAEDSRARFRAVLLEELVDEQDTIKFFRVGITLDGTHVEVTLASILGEVRKENNIQRAKARAVGSRVSKEHRFITALKDEGE